MQIDKKQKHIIATVLLINTLIVIIFLPVGGCPWKEQFNIDCAGCGTTRMFKSIIELEIYQAFRYNPLMFILFSIAALYGIYSLICKLLKKKPITLNKKSWIILSTIVVILLIIYTILRNINGFEFLKPTIIN